MPAVEVFDEIDWAPKPVLRPGMDFRDGVLYFTIPLTRNLVKKGKGKGAPDIAYKELNTFTISSAHEGFWYDEDSLATEGFLTAEQVYQEHTPRWSLNSAKDFLEGSTQAPASNEIYGRLRQIYETYVEFNEEIFYDLMSLYVLYTYVFRLFENTGYIHFNGTQASGKSRNLSIIDTLAFNALWSSNISPASLYRKLAGSPGTTCIDESEGFDGERGEDLRRILNAGYKDGATAIRTEKGPNDRFVPIEYDVFGPKALASINPLEPVIASRCVIISMRPAIRQLAEFQTRSPEWGDVRDALYLWAMDNAAGVNATAQAWRDDKKKRLAPRLIGRQWEVTSQFVILADYIEGEDFACRVIAHFNEYFAKQQAAADANDRLRATLRALPRVLNQKAPHAGNFYSVKDIHDVVSSFMEEDAKDAFKTKHAGKNMEIIGFRERVRASGGIRIRIDEDALRAEFRQRRVDPYPEDEGWLAGTVSYQSNSHPKDPKDVEPWWEPKEAE